MFDPFVADRMADRRGRIHDHDFPESTGRSGCLACDVRLGRVPIGYSDNLGYLWCTFHAPTDDPRRLPLIPIFATAGPHDAEPCERCGRILRDIWPIAPATAR